MKGNNEQNEKKERRPFFFSLKKRIRKAFEQMPSVTEQEALEKAQEIEQKMEGKLPSK